MPENAEYAGKLAKYEHRKRFLLHYGEPSLELIPVVTPIQPVLEAALLSPILTESRDALRDAILEKIAAMRGHFRDRFGLTIPGVSFTDIAEGSSRPGTYFLMVMGKLKEEGRIPPEKTFVPAEDRKTLGLTGEPTEAHRRGSSAKRTLARRKPGRVRS